MDNNTKISSLQISIFVFFLSQVSFFPVISHILFKTTKQDTWISVIIGCVIGFIFIKLFLFLQQKKKDMSIFEYCVYKLGNIFGNTINIFLCFITLFIITIIFSKFCVFLNVNFLNEIPTLALGLFLLLVSIYAVNKGFETISRTAQLLAILSLILFVLGFVLLIYYTDVNNIKPIFNSGISNITKSSLLYSLSSIIPIFLLLVVPKTEVTNIKNYNKSVLLGYIISTVMTFLIFLITILVLGSNLAIIFEYPEYIALKQIQFFHFVERLENFISIIWIFNVFVFTTFGIYFIDEFLKFKFNISNKKNKFVLLLILVIIILFSNIILYMR